MLPHAGAENIPVEPDPDNAGAGSPSIRFTDIPELAASQPVGDWMNVIVNGEPLTLSNGNTVGTLLAQLDLSATHVAVVLNGRIVAAAERASRTLAPGDEIELLTLAGGG